MIVVIKIPFGSPPAPLCYVAYTQNMQKEKTVAGLSPYYWVFWIQQINVRLLNHYIALVFPPLHSEEGIQNMRGIFFFPYNPS